MAPTQISGLLALATFKVAVGIFARICVELVEVYCVLVSPLDNWVVHSSCSCKYSVGSLCSSNYVSYCLITARKQSFHKSNEVPWERCEYRTYTIDAITFLGGFLIFPVHKTGKNINF